MKPDVTLEPIARKHVNVLAQAANNKNIWDNVRDYFPFPYTEKEAEDFVEKCLEKEPQVNFCIMYEGKFAGFVSLVPQTDVYKHSAELGYWIRQEYWNKGIATNAVQLIVEYGFSQLRLGRIIAGVFSFNTASQRVLEKCGFMKEGTLRGAVVKNNEICDEIRYGLIRNGNLKSAEYCENMNDVRAGIDAIDRKIVILLAERARYVHRAANFKKNAIDVADKERVAQVIASKKHLAIEMGVSPELVGIIFEKMISHFIAEEMQE